MYSVTTHASTPSTRPRTSTHGRGPCSATATASRTTQSRSARISRKPNAFFQSCPTDIVPALSMLVKSSALGEFRSFSCARRFGCLRQDPAAKCPHLGARLGSFWADEVIGETGGHAQIERPDELPARQRIGGERASRERDPLPFDGG